MSRKAPCTKVVAAKTAPPPEVQSICDRCSIEMPVTDAVDCEHCGTLAVEVVRDDAGKVAKVSLIGTVTIDGVTRVNTFAFTPEEFCVLMPVLLSISAELV